MAFLDYDTCNRFQFPEGIPTEGSLNDYIQRDVRQDDKYYYTESSRLYGELQQVVTDKDAFYLITDYGVSRKKHYIASTLKANMGTFPDRVPVLRDGYGIRRITETECLALQGFPKEYAFSPNISLDAKYKQVGNTVCVPVVRRIAEKLAEVLQ